MMTWLAGHHRAHPENGSLFPPCKQMKDDDPFIRPTMYWSNSFSIEAKFKCAWFICACWKQRCEPWFCSAIRVTLFPVDPRSQFMGRDLPFPPPLLENMSIAFGNHFALRDVFPLDIRS
jgi:hypothetical protein